MEYRRCGKTGLKVSVLSLGMWQNFGDDSDFERTKETVLSAFESGINSFDLANNYGPKEGSAERRFGEIFHKCLSSHRGEILVSTKAGYRMWPGPFGEGGSKKYLVSSINDSLKRTGLDYFDIFYHHRPDSETPLEETAEALAYIINSGKALYVALSNYGEEIFEIKKILETDYHIHPIINQVSYSILNKRGDPEGTLFPRMKEEGIGIFAFSPLSQGRLTDKYLSGTVPPDSRANESKFLTPEDITQPLIEALNKLNAVAAKRGQKLSHMALNWDLEREGMTSLIVGARNKEQILDSVSMLETYSSFSPEEERAISKIVRKIQFRR